MKQLLIICVNHNTYTELNKFLVSIDTAVQQVADCMRVCVAVADNTPLENRKTIHTQYTSISVLPYPLDSNDGYLGSADYLLALLRRESQADADYCVISNVDLQIAPLFFKKLLSFDTTNVGWIAPDIHTLATKKHENPFMRIRPSKLQMSIWRLMYRLPILFYMQRKIAKLLANKNKKESTITGNIDIYAGHGSIMILTRAFMDTYQTGKFPGFMYGEEIYLAELVQRAGLHTTYLPRLEVYNTGGVSTSSLNLCRKAEMNYTSLTALQREYFKKKQII